MVKYPLRVNIYMLPSSCRINLTQYCLTLTYVLPKNIYDAASRFNIAANFRKLMCTLIQEMILGHIRVFFNQVDKNECPIIVTT